MIWHWDALNGSCDVAKNKVILCTWCNARVYTLFLLFYAPFFCNALIFTKRCVLWLASYPLRCDWMNTSSTWQKCYGPYYSENKSYTSGRRYADLWGRVWIKHLVGVGICGGLQILYMHKQVLKDRVKPEVPSYEPFKISTEHFIS